MLEQGTFRNALRGVFQLLKGLFAPVTGPSSMAGVVSAYADRILDEFFIIDDGRSEVYAAAEEMDETVDEVAAALDILADNAVNAENGDRGAFQLVWKTSKIPEIEEMLERVRWRERRML